MQRIRKLFSYNMKFKYTHNEKFRLYHIVYMCRQIVKQTSSKLSDGMVYGTILVSIVIQLAFSYTIHAYG